MYDYKIVTKPQFALVGYTRKFDSKTSYEEIPKFWHDHYLNETKKVCGMYGVCYDCDNDGNFRYMIADDFDMTKDAPPRTRVIVIPALTWAVFQCIGAMPKALQDVNTYIFNEWLPNSKQYRMVGDLNIESYCSTPPKNVNNDDYSEIWIPVEEIK